MAPGFFPLDDELALLPGNLTPRLQESLVRLATHIPSFAKASQEFAWLTGARVHPDTARRHTEAAGVALVARETAEAARILREHPAPPCIPDALLFSVDGAMIPLVHGQRTEVRTLAVGEVQPATPTAAGPVVCTTRLKGESIDLLGRQQAYPSQAVYPKLKGVERLFRSNTKEVWLIARHHQDLVIYYFCTI